MSIYAFGMVVHRPDISTADEEALEWEVIENGVSCHVYVKLRANIYIKEIMDMLWKSELADGPHIDFLITASPLDNTSDCLVRPLCNGKDNIEMVSTNLKKISDWMTLLIANKDIVKIYLYISEAFDAGYKIVVADRNNIFKVLKSQLDGSGEVSPFVMEVD